MAIRNPAITLKLDQPNFSVIAVLFLFIYSYKSETYEPRKNGSSWYNILPVRCTSESQRFARCAILLLYGQQYYVQEIEIEANYRSD